MDDTNFFPHSEEENNNNDTSMSDIKPEEVDIENIENIEDFKTESEIFSGESSTSDSDMSDDTTIINPDDDEEKENEMSSTMADYTAKWLVDIFCNVLTLILTQYAKIDKKLITQAIFEGYLDAKHLKMIDDQNRNNEKRLAISDTDKKMILSPVDSLVKSKGISVPPSLQILLSVGIITTKQFFIAKDIKEVNETVLRQILAEIQNKKRTNSEIDDYDDIILNDDNVEN